MKPLLVTSGEPAGIGPDLCLALSAYDFPVVICGDIDLLRCRAELLNYKISFQDYNPNCPQNFQPGKLTILSVPCKSFVVPGILNVNNASYVLTMLNLATIKCLAGEFSGLVTAPVHKGVINESGITFSGHTEFLAKICNAEHVVMLLVANTLRVALATTHLPLRDVPDAITSELLINTITTLHFGLQRDFCIKNPQILVSGLNPHAGEKGHLGTEELDIIIPSLHFLQKQGFNVNGPFPADTLFTPSRLEHADAILAMYHDQGLPVLKYIGFGSAVNVSLGLPIVRTSVDHGTALELAGTGKADLGSLLNAVKLALALVEQRYNEKN